MCFKKLKEFFLKVFCKPEGDRPKISLLIPFSSNDPIRKKNFRWLLRYWAHELPDAEIVIGKSHGRIFCKGEALNNAVRKSRGRILVILDADAYLPGHIIEYCSNRILEELELGNNLWYVPYRRLFRLREWITHLILKSDPECPLELPYPFPLNWSEDNGNKSRYGHRYGAMIMMFPREAYETLGCFDERFRGWGGEDIALLRALDTLFGKHKTVNNDIFHLWHPFIGENYKTRKWKGQKHANINSELANKYNRANRKPTKMRKLVDEGCKFKRKLWEQIF